jgi:urea transporter
MFDRISKLVRSTTAAAQGIVRSYAEIFFLSRAAVGFVLVVGTLLNWRIGAAGLLAVAAAYGFARLIRMDARALQSGYYTYNPLLVGLSLGATLPWSWSAALLIAAGGVLTFLLTSAIVHVFRTYFNLPALSLPFVVGSAVMHTAVLRYSSLGVNPRKLGEFLSDDFGLPLIIVGFCKALGAIMFVPSVAVGAMFSLLLLVRSRILFCLAVAGYYLGTSLRGCLLDSFEQAYLDVYSFNFLLIAMAVGGVFLVPSGTSFLIAAAGVMLAIVLVDAVQVFGYFFAVPAYTLPFNVVTLGVLYALGVHQFPGLARVIGTTPEETMENDIAGRRRFCEVGRTLTLPFFGGWTVWQGFDDEWTHQGPWRYAYDFVITGEDGRTHAGDGSQLRDYFCYRKPVLSPCRGRVVKVVNDLPDNPVGRVDKTHNWGNHVVVLDERGFYVELSHFAPESIAVKVGQQVDRGQLLGLCGNSGYSPQPHLHIHVQATEQVDAGTLPFSFARFRCGDVFFAQARPEKGTVVEPAVVDDRLDAAMEFLLNDELTFDVVKRGYTIGSLRLNVKMAIDGTLYLDCPGRGKLYFGKLDGTFYFYRLEGRDPLLAMLFAALPRLPLVRGRRQVWHDCVPVGLATRGLQRALLLAVAPFYAPAARAETTHRFVARDIIETSVRLPLGLSAPPLRTVLDDRYGIASVTSGDMELRVRRDDVVHRKSEVTTVHDRWSDADEPKESEVLIAAAR